MRIRCPSGSKTTPVGRSAGSPMAFARFSDPAMTWISARASNASSRRSMMVIGRILDSVSQTVPEGA
jgi:hypothetical protein